MAMVLTATKLSGIKENSILWKNYIGNLWSSNSPYCYVQPFTPSVLSDLSESVIATAEFSKFQDYNFILAIDDIWGAIPVEVYIFVSNYYSEAELLGPIVMML